MTLDFTDNITILNETPLLNYHSILQLKEGIFMVYNHMNFLQKNYIRLSNPEYTDKQIRKEEDGLLYSYSFGMSKIDAQAINLYHWYSVNLISYAKSCALIKFLNKNKLLANKIPQNKKIIQELKNEQNSYIDSIPELQPVKRYRDKAGAHLAFTDPRKHDNQSTLNESMSLCPVFNEGLLKLGKFKKYHAGEISSISEYQWNLTENFESLIPRYFKDDDTFLSQPFKYRK